MEPVVLDVVTDVQDHAKEVVTEVALVHARVLVGELAKHTVREIANNHLV